MVLGSRAMSSGIGGAGASGGHRHAFIGQDGAAWAGPEPFADGASEYLVDGPSPCEGAPSLEPWEATEPSVRFWIGSFLDRGQPPDAELLLQYADALVGRGRLDELGCLARLVGRTCAGLEVCEDMLRAFADGVDALVAASYDGARFEPLSGIRSALGERGRRA
jgi:hypothetical protein